MKVLIILLFAVQAQAFNDNTNTNVCKPVVNVTSCKAPCQAPCKTRVKTKVVYKTKEKIVEKKVEIVKQKTFKNHASLIVGYGALGNINESIDNGTATFRTEQGLVMGLQYMRDISTHDNYSVHLGIQGQTNKTFSLMGGVGF